MKIVAALISVLLLACDEIVTSEAVVLPNFYPFGQSEGDQLLPPNDDESSGTVPISIPFPFFDRNHNSLFVSRKSLFYLRVYQGVGIEKKGRPKLIMKASMSLTWIWICSAREMLVRFKAVQLNTLRH